MQLLSADSSRNNNHYRFSFSTKEYVRENVTYARLGFPNEYLN